MKVDDKYKLKMKVITKGGDYFEKDEIVLYNGYHSTAKNLHEFVSLDYQSFLVFPVSQINKFLEKL